MKWVTFSVNINSTQLKIPKITNYQEQLYNTVKKYKTNYGYGYRRISKILNTKGYTTTRSNKEFEQNYVHSIWKKGQIREERLNRNFKLDVKNMNLNIRQ